MQGDQWGLAHVKAPAAWSTATGVGTKIAIVDTGVDLAHVDLQAKIGGSVTCLDTDGDPKNCTPGGQDVHGHGSHVAGIAAADTGNGVGIAGTAPGASILAVQVLDKDGRGEATDIEAGIRWAVANGASVINLSLGAGIRVLGLLESFTEAVNFAWEQGVIVVVAAGNDSLLAIYNDLDAIVVTATDNTDRQASYAANVGSMKWGIAAPGGENADPPQPSTDIVSTYWDGKNPSAYAAMAGTSMSTPFVAGGAALLRSFGLTPQQTVDRLLDTAARPPGCSALACGAGLLDLEAAVAGLRPPPSTAPPSTAPRGEPPGSSAPSTTAPSPSPQVAPAPTVRPTPRTPPSSALMIEVPGQEPDDSEDALPRAKGLLPQLPDGSNQALADEGDGPGLMPLLIAGGGLLASVGALWLLRRRPDTAPGVYID